MPSCLPWKWTNKHRSSSKHNTDYIYLQWHFMTSQQDQDQDLVSNTITSKTSSRAQPAVSNNKTAVRRSSGEEERGENSEERKYADIQSWLSSLPDSVCTEIYCDCCDGLQQTPPPPPPPPVLPRRQDSITSVTSVSSSNCSCSECLQSSQLSDDESLYSIQLRRKSRDIFLS